MTAPTTRPKRTRNTDPDNGEKKGDVTQAATEEGSPAKKLKADGNDKLLDSPDFGGELTPVSSVVGSPASSPATLPTFTEAVKRSNKEAVPPSTLEYVPFISFRQDQEIDTPLVNLAHAFPKSGGRLLGFDTLQPKSTELVNLAMVEPAALKKDQCFKLKVQTQSFTAFFLVGLVTASSLAKPNQASSISIAFSDRTFPRAIAAVANVIRQEKLVVPVYMNGATLSTYKKSNGTPIKSQGSMTSVQNKLAPPSPSKGKLVFKTPIKAFGESIPVYDGRRAFKMQNYQALPRMQGEVDECAAVAAVFSLTTYPVATGDTALSFNIQDVVLLANPEDSDPNAPLNRSEPLWVANYPEMEGDNEPELTSDDEELM